MISDSFIHVVIGISITFNYVVIAILIKRISDIQTQISKIYNKREKLYANLADPELIMAEMEKSARMREMRDANRTTLPRDDAGPPAKVHRPKLRAAKPSRWNPPQV